MVKHLITDISEEDFRKLDIKVYVHKKIKNVKGHEQLMMAEESANDILTRELNLMLADGYERDLENLSIPITFAIHVDNDLTEEEINYAPMCHGYFDKFMNRFTPIATYYIAEGIKHLYSTRDYYEDHEDYWRVRKAETKVIYRIKVDQSWRDKFVLKHRTIVETTEDPHVTIEKDYDLVDDEWVEISKTKVTKGQYRTIYEPIK